MSYKIILKKSLVVFSALYLIIVSLHVSMANAKEEDFKIYSSDSYRLFSLERLQNFTKLKFMLPDYLPKGIEFNAINIVNKDNSYPEGYIEVNFTSSFSKVHCNNSYSFSMIISKNNPIDSLKNSFKQQNGNISFSESPSSISNTKGTTLSCHIDHVTQDLSWQKNEKVNLPISGDEKYFIWEHNDGLWYSIMYSNKYVYSEHENNNRAGYLVPLSYFQPIIESMKYIKDITKVKYKCNDLYNNIIDIYDSIDLKRAKNSLGFSPTIPEVLPEEQKLLHSTAVLYHTNEWGIDFDYDNLDYISQHKNDVSNSVQFFESLKANWLLNFFSQNDAGEYSQQSTYFKKAAFIINNTDIFANTHSNIYFWHKNNIYYCAKLGKACNAKNILKYLVK